MHHRPLVVALFGLRLCVSAALGQGVAAAPGVTVRVYRVEDAPEFVPTIVDESAANLVEVRDRLDLAADDFGGIEGPIVTHVVGDLIVDTGAPAQFRLTSDDGSRLYVDGRLVIDHDGRHAASAKTSAPTILERGPHALRVEHFDAGGSRRLLLEWKPAGADRFEVVTSKHTSTTERQAEAAATGFAAVAPGRSPGDGRPLDGVHPGWTLSTVRPEGFEPKVGAMTFLPDGRLIVGLFDPLQRDEKELPDIDIKEPDSLFALDHLDSDDPGDVTVTRVAGDLYEPSAMCVIDGELYVANRKAVLRLRDTDGDGFYETHDVIGQGWEGWNYHQFVFGLEHIDGKLYCGLSTAMAPPGWEGMETNAGPNGPMRGGMVEIDLATGDTRVIAGGTRVPNGLGRSPDGALVYLDNQGAWLPASKLCEVLPGRFYGHYNWTRFVPKLAARFPIGGHPSVFCDRPWAPAAVILPHNEVVNSPTQPLPVTSGPFAGQMLVGELTGGGVRRVFLERVNGQLQGALFRFTQGFEVGVNRMAWGPDGSLYIGGIGAGGNWNWKGTQYGLQRLTPNGTTVFEMLEVRATPTGFRIEFTKPIDPAWLANPAGYLVTSWTYKPTQEYGGPKVDVRPHGVLKATPGDDGRSVTLDVDGLEPWRCYHIRTDPVSTDGERIWSTESWYTLNAIPRATPVEMSSIGEHAVRPEALGVGVLPPRDAISLIGKCTSPTMFFESASGTPDPLAQDDIIAGGDGMAVGKDSGDLVSKTEFGDARLHVEWLSPPGGVGQLAGNSGVYLHDRYEIQILGTPADKVGLADDDAGAIYGVKPADANASTGPGTWQAYDIWFRAPRFRDGRKIETARVTMYWNGLLVHDNVAIERGTGSRSGVAEAPAPGTDTQLGVLRFQDHASMSQDPVKFRNVWIAPIEPGPSTPGPWRNILDTDEWVVRGGEATFEAKRGELVGSTKPDTPNTFYTSVDTYSDFELIFEVRTDRRLNSGVQIRSTVEGGFDTRAGPLNGYQIEVDPSERAYTAGVYEERGRGWLHPLHTTPYARRAYSPEAWNEIRVVAQGPVIRTWLNGIPAAEVYDERRRSGNIAFQVHSVGAFSRPLDVRFRDVRLRELSPG